MTDDKLYREAFERAKGDLREALDRKAKAITKAESAHEDSIRLRRVVGALAILCGENVEDSMGLTEAVRMIYKTANADTWLSVKQVKAHVEGLGVNLDDLKNPEASVMSVLSRLANGGELQTGQRQEKTQTGHPFNVKVWRVRPPAKEKPKQEVDDPPMEPITDDDIPF